MLQLLLHLPVLVAAPSQRLHRHLKGLSYLRLLYLLFQISLRDHLPLLPPCPLRSYRHPWYRHPSSPSPSSGRNAARLRRSGAVAGCRRQLRNTCRYRGPLPWL